MASAALPEGSVRVEPARALSSRSESRAQPPSGLLIEPATRPGASVLDADLDVPLPTLPRSPSQPTAAVRARSALASRPPRGLLLFGGFLHFCRNAFVREPAVLVQHEAVVSLVSLFHGELIPPGWGERHRFPSPQSCAEQYGLLLLTSQLLPVVAVPSFAVQTRAVPACGAGALPSSVVSPVVVPLRWQRSGAAPAPPRVAARPPHGSPVLPVFVPFCSPRVPFAALSSLVLPKPPPPAIALLSLLHLQRWSLPVAVPTA